MPPLADHLIRNFGITATFIMSGGSDCRTGDSVRILVVRTRPEGAVKTTVAEQIKSLPGLDVGPAMATRAFWLLALVQGLEWPG